VPERKPAFVPAARDQGLQLDTLVHHQCASAFRPAHLVCRERHRMHAGSVERAKIQRTLAESLHRVGMEPDPCGLGLYR
jgi:S-adenosylmethionine:tRNA-ribosyltransferase-isomerase (queuine synthetase)